VAAVIHTAASLAVSAGANVKAVQRILGHASAAMTLDIYADLFDDDLEAVATALDKARARESVGKMRARVLSPTRDSPPTCGFTGVGWRLPRNSRGSIPLAPGDSVPRPSCQSLFAANVAAWLVNPD
jgi:hypothetical protein